jgi:hypothetical protein
VRNLRLAKKPSRPEPDCGERSAPVATKVISLIFPQFFHLSNATELQIFIYRTRLYSGCLDQKSLGLDWLFLIHHNHFLDPEAIRSR